MYMLSIVFIRMGVPVCKRLRFPVLLLSFLPLTSLPTHGSNVCCGPFLATHCGRVINKVFMAIDSLFKNTLTISKSTHTHICMPVQMKLIVMQMCQRICGYIYMYDTGLPVQRCMAEQLVIECKIHHCQSSATCFGYSGLMYLKLFKLCYKVVPKFRMPIARMLFCCNCIVMTSVLIQRCICRQ